MSNHKKYTRHVALALLLALLSAITVGACKGDSSIPGFVDGGDGILPSTQVKQPHRFGSPIPPYAKVQVSVNGGGIQTGGIVVHNSDSIALTAASTVGWSTQKWEIYEYPVGFTVPAGWSTDANSVYYSAAVSPPSFTLPASTDLWGKYFIRLRVNDALTNSSAQSKFTDESTALEIVSANGFHDVGAGETNQFDTQRQWVGPYKANLRLMDQGGASATSTQKINSQRVPWKATARFAITSNVSSLASFTVAASEGTAVQGDRLLLTGQTTGSQNGLYDVGSVSAGHAPLTRSSDMAASADCIPGSRVHASEGVNFRNTEWYLGTSGAITLGSTSLNFQLSDVSVNLRRFGAKGDGTTDDTAALQAWLAAIPDGAEGYIPPGTYRFTTGLSFGLNGSGKPKRINLRGEGIASILLADVGTSADGLTIGILAPAPTTGPFAYVEGIHLSNFVVMGQGNVRHALRLNNLARCTSRNVHVLGGTRTGGIDVYIYGALINDFQFIVSTNQQYPGFTNPGVSNTHLVYLQDAGPTNPGVLSQCNANKFHLFAEGGTGVAVYQDDQAGYGDNWFDGTVESASSSAAFYFKNSADWVVHNCHIEGFAGGIVIDGGHAGTIGPGVPVVTITGASTATGAGVRIDPRIGGIARVDGEVGLTAAADGPALYTGPTSGVSGRIAIGDGSGRYYGLSKRTASAWTDLFKFYDNGLAYGPIWIGDSFQVNSGTTCSSTGLYNAPKNASILKMRNAANGADIPVITGTATDQLLIGDATVQAVTTSVNSAGFFNVNDGSVNWLDASAAKLRTQAPVVGWYSGVTPTVKIEAATSNVACHDVTLEGQTPYASATGTNRDSKGYRFVISSPVAGGANGQVKIDTAGGSHTQFVVDDTGVQLAGAGGAIKWGTPLVSGGGGGTATLGTVGGSGPASTVQNSWMQVTDSAGNLFWVPVWK